MYPEVAATKQPNAEVQSASNYKNCCHAVRANEFIGRIPIQLLAKTLCTGPYCSAKLHYNVKRFSGVNPH